MLDPSRLREVLRKLPVRPPRHRVRARVHAHLLLQRAAGGLHHVAVHLLLHARRVDHQPRVVPHHHAAHVHLARHAIHFHVGHPGGEGGAEARELAVHVARIGEALALQQVAGGGLLLRLRVRDPAGPLGGGLHELHRAHVLQVAQAELHRVGVRGGGQLVDIRLVRERVRQGRHAAQPRRAQDRRHVVRHHAHRPVVVRWNGRAVAHLVGHRQRLDGARERLALLREEDLRLRNVNRSSRHAGLRSSTCASPARAVCGATQWNSNSWRSPQGQGSKCR